MQSIQKKILMLAVTIALFSSVAFADGEMGGGGLWGNESSPTKVVSVSDEGQATSGTSTAASDAEIGLDWLMSSIAELLGLND